MDKITTTEDLRKEAIAPFYITFESTVATLRATGYGKTKQEARNNLKSKLEELREELSNILSKLST
jgi:hypothetical protein